LLDPERLKVINIREYDRLKEMVLQQLREFHQRFPMKSGLAKEELRTKLPAELDVKLFQILLNELVQSKEMVLERDKLRLPDHQLGASPMTAIDIYDSFSRLGACLSADFFAFPHCIFAVIISCDRLLTWK
jgi:hypothetical protein